MEKLFRNVGLKVVNQRKCICLIINLHLSIYVSAIHLSILWSSSLASWPSKYVLVYLVKSWLLEGTYSLQMFPNFWMAIYLNKPTHVHRKKKVIIYPSKCPHASYVLRNAATIKLEWRKVSGSPLLSWGLSGHNCWILAVLVLYRKWIFFAGLLCALALVSIYFGNII